MRFFLVVLLLAAISQQLQAKCAPSSADKKADVHWSDSSVTAGPDCSAFIEVVADPKGNAAATVHLRREGSSKVQLPLNVFRDGTLYWEHTGRRVVYQDAYSYGVYRLWLVDIGTKATDAPRTMLLDESLRRVVDSSLGPNQSVARFWPDLVMWLSDSVLVTVRLQTLNGNSGPLTERCLGFLVSTVRENQITSISDTDLKSKYKAGCRRNEK
jgi:hypothetical protein